MRAVSWPKVNYKMMFISVVFAAVVCYGASFKCSSGCVRSAGLWGQTKNTVMKSAALPGKHSAKLHELMATPTGDIADNLRLKFLSAYSILFGAYVVRGLYPVIEKVAVKLNHCNSGFQDRTLDQTLESIMSASNFEFGQSLPQADFPGCELETAVPAISGHLEKDLEILGNSLMVVVHNTVARLGKEDGAHSVVREWSKDEFKNLLERLHSIKWETIDAAERDEIFVFDQLMQCLRRLSNDRKYAYFDDNVFDD